MISSRDLKEVVDRLTGDQKLEDEDMQQLIDNVRHLTCMHESSLGISVVESLLGIIIASII